MTEATADKSAAADKKMYGEQKAFILGYTGEVGKELVKALLNKQVFQQIVFIGRRQIDFPDQELYKNVEQKVIDFDKLEESKAAFDGCTVGFCCLGTTRGKAGKDGFYKVDHDYVVNSAKIAKETGCQHFSLVTSTGANKDSMMFYMKTKGVTEQDVIDLGFAKLTIFRPATLMCDREESRFGEKVWVTLLKGVNTFSPTFLSVPTVTVAKAMIYKLFYKDHSPIEIVENGKIHELGAEFDKEF